MSGYFVATIKPTGLGASCWRPEPSDLYSYPILILYATKKLRCKLFQSKHISRCPPQEGCFGGLLCSHITKWEPPCFIPGVLGRFHRGGTLFLWTRSTRARAGLCTDPKHLKRGRSILTIDLNSHLRWRRSHFLKPATMLYLYKILLLMVLLSSLKDRNGKRTAVNVFPIHLDWKRANKDVS